MTRANAPARVRKVWRRWRRKGFDVARCTVARLMRQMGLKGATRGKAGRTTFSERAAPYPADRVNRRGDWFNHRHRLEPIGNIPPAEARYYAQTEDGATAA